MWAEFVDTKLMTRATYTLAGVNGPLEDKGGLTFTEKDGIDYAPATVQLPGGERVPFMFTVKELVAKTSDKSISAGTEFSGTFRVPSYRSGLFLDPKGRGGTTGYDMAQALPGMEADGAEGQAERTGGEPHAGVTIPGGTTLTPSDHLPRRRARRRGR